MYSMSGLNYKLFTAFSLKRPVLCIKPPGIKQEQNDIKVVGYDPNETISADPAIMKRGRAEYSSPSNANKRKAESKVKSSKPKKEDS